MPTLMTLQAGIHDEIPAETYHSDPAPEPSLSAGIAHRLVSRSPLHAHEAHPRLNAAHEDQTAGNLDFGTAAHALLLQGTDICQIVESSDWRTNMAKDAREEARRSGLIPLLRKDWQRMCDLTVQVRQQLARLDVHPRPLADGKPEQTLVWQEDNGIWCRARIDWLHDAHDVLDDLKTTATSANPRDWARNRLFADGKDVQAAWYLRGLKHLTGQDATWRFVVVETEPPYALSVISLAPSALELANRKVDYAIKKWRECLQADHWPAYPREVASVELDSWADADFLRLTYGEEVAV